MSPFKMVSLQVYFRPDWYGSFMNPDIESNDHLPRMIHSTETTPLGTGGIYDIALHQTCDRLGVEH